MRLRPLPALLLAFFAASWALAQDAPVAKEAAGGGKEVAFRTLDLGAYAAFPKNWDDAKHPLRAALIGDGEQWSQVFNPAWRRNLPTAPAAALYEKEQLMMVSRVVNGDDLGKVFAVVSASAHGDALVVRTTFTPGEGKATFTAKDCALVAVPKHAYAKVVLVENGRVAAVLDQAHAQLPAAEGAPAPQPDAAKAAVCPVCTKAGVPVVYGKPGKELMDRAQRGEVVLGGCCVTGDEPHHGCKGCDVQW